MSPTEEIFDGTVTWGTSGAGYLTQKIGTGTQIIHRSPWFAYAVDDVAVLAVGEDPMLHIRNQLADAINKLNTDRLFEQLTGLFHTALNDHRLEKQLGGSFSTAEANYLTASTVAEARAKLGERGEEMDLLIVHPSVAYYLYQVGLLTSTSALAASGAVTWGGGGVGVGAREVGEFAGMSRHC